MLTSSGYDAVKQYQAVDTQASVEGASPYRLIQLMMQRALTKIAAGKAHLQRAEVARKGACIGDAISIINGLQASLNHKADKKLAANFDALYEYMMRRLLQGNLHDDVAAFDEVSNLLGEIKEAWDAIADEVE